jgi:NAD(P)-dependent dehydrogenase (short-subunit alcohol dehydrogenase family)
MTLLFQLTESLNMGRLEGRSILISGAASGIGRAIALRFAAEGARLVLADLTTVVREGGEPTIDLLRTQGATADHLQTDVSDEAAAAQAVDFCVKRDGRLDVLVNNAAISVGKPLLETSLGEWNRVFAVNLTGVFLMSRAAIRVMLQQDEDGLGVRGRLVNISSQHGMVASPEDVSYGTSKSGVVYITRQIAVDYAPAGIICNAIAPGKILTGKTGRAVEPKWLDYSRRRTPMPRLGSPGDVASAALFLASDDASFITGENLLVDGGWMAG